MGNDRWRRAGVWVTSGGIAAGALVGCQPTATTPADGPVRSDVTDIRPLARATAAASSYDPPLYDTTGLIPTAPQPVTEPAAAPAAATVAPSDVMFTTIAPPPPPPPATSHKRPTVATAQGRTHVVRRGETWFAIARAQYGDGAQWHRLAAANPAAVGPLRVGQQLVLP